VPRDRAGELMNTLRQGMIDITTASLSQVREVPAVQTRMAAMLWGVFIADALSAPAHWYYDTAAMRRDYGGDITFYVAPKPVHSGNVIMSNHWRDNKHNVRGLVEGGHMLHGKGQVWATQLAHYHSGLEAGENTLNSLCARVVMRQMAQDGGRYEAAAVLDAYKRFMTTPGSHNDAYAEAFHRQFFHNHLIEGRPLEDAAGAENHDTPSIGGFVMLPPVLLISEVEGPQAAVETTLKHLNLTHRSARLAAMATVYSGALLSVLQGGELQEAALRGGALLGWDLRAVVEEGLPDAVVVSQVMGPACYISDSLPVVFYLAYKYGHDPATAMERALLANTNAGGENAHRGSALGALIGAAVGMENIPQKLLTGLAAHAELKSEITALCDALADRARSDHKAEL